MNAFAGNLAASQVYIDDARAAELPIIAEVQAMPADLGLCQLQWVFQRQD